MTSGSPWFVSCAGQSGRDPQFRLFCFHYAGGSGSMFLPWTKWLPDEVELVAVQLPGRENRSDEPLVHSMELITQPLADAITPLLDKPFALFGHSTGAAISFELVRELRKRALPQPRLLVASGQNAPRFKPAVLRHLLSDPEFIEVIRRCKGTPDAVLSSPLFVEMLLPRIRADGAVYETYRYQPQAPLDCRIVLFHGVEDDMVTSEGLAGWRLETRHSFERYGFAGSHLFLHQEEAALGALINRELEPLLAEQAA
jgi:medium-chain acyl-[acyl-carrier-protein] hydrolase